MSTADLHAQITVFARHPADELLLMASDGLWDVMPNQVRQQRAAALC